MEVVGRSPAPKPSAQRRPPRVVRLVQWIGLSGTVLIISGFTLMMNPAGSTNLSHPTKPGPLVPVNSRIEFLNGTTDPSEPSGQAPMAANALPGYTQTYVNDFNGLTLPPGWDVFAGTASGDTGSQFGAAHVTLANGLLSLNTWQDPAYGNEWVTGGLCQCATSMTYGAFFVRSRVTGPGPTIVELLWPLAGWPPEIDFNETGGTTDGTTATAIWAANGGQDQVHLQVDMTQWHTWGVVWTPTTILYTVDGNIWGQFSVSTDIPHQPLSLHLQQQTWCTSNYACPTQAQSAQIDWVAEYNPIANTTTNVGPFSPRSAILDDSMRSKILELAASIDSQGARSVSLTGYSDSKTKTTAARSIALARASLVKSYLLRALTSLGDNGVTVSATAANEANPATFTNSQSGRARNARVTVRLLQIPPA